MQALQFHKTGAPEVLQVDSVPTPEPGKGAVRIKVAYSGINFADTERRRGLYDALGPLPRILGSEASGVIDAIGEGVDPKLMNIRVTALIAFSSAEHVVAPISVVFPAPEGITLKDAASLPVQGLTAYHLLHTAHSVQAGDRVLVHSGAGGVGTFLIQLAKAAGAEVFATVSSAEKADLVLALGAKAAIRYDQVDFPKEVMKLTGTSGVDLILDAVGAATFQKNLSCLAPFGHAISYGSASGKPQAIEPSVLLERSLKISSYWLRSPHPSNAHQIGMSELFSCIRSGQLKPVIDRVFKLTREDAVESHHWLEGRRTRGKLLYEIAP